MIAIGMLTRVKCAINANARRPCVRVFDCTSTTIKHVKHIIIIYVYAHACARVRVRVCLSAHYTPYLLARELINVCTPYLLESVRDVQ
jgi:hypothetical protein